MPRKSPEPAEESAASSAGSSTSSSSPYTEGGGPGFDPNQAPARPPVEDETAEQFIERWQQEQVRDWLRNSGALAHAAFGVGEHDWEMTKSDLDRIAPPATRILNRYQPTRVVAAYSDPAAVAIGFGLYGWRSALERIAVNKTRREGTTEEPEPLFETGREDGAGPSVAEDYVPFAERLNRTPTEEDQ